MSNFPVNHDSLYFDRLIRVFKAESVNALIFATYYADSTSDRKDDIARRLEHSYNLFKKSSGSYDGSINKFDSQYTIGHEMAIWKNSKLELNDLALEVAKFKITIREYFDIIFYNYVQPIKETNVHLLHTILTSMQESSKTSILTTEVQNLFPGSDLEDVRALCNFLNGTQMFEFKGNELKFISILSITEQIENCNLTYIGVDGFKKARIELNEEAAYIEYITSRNKISHSSSSGLTSVINGSNELYYGVPGSGKSFQLIQKYQLSESNSIRTVFFPDYTNSDFIGQIFPTLHNGSPIYEFKPGPFTQALELAFSNKDKMIYLIIEEINRGNASSIFGEIFQLLDRNDKGASLYSIQNKNVVDYLNLKKVQVNHVSIPSNLSIIATMNSSDQNVFNLDTAFKRRWIMRKVKNNFTVDHPLGELYIPGTSTKWSEFVEKVNKHILENNYRSLNSEDKQLGTFYVSGADLSSSEYDADKDKIERFTEKVFHYIWEDVAKINRDDWFDKSIVSFDDLVDDFRENGLKVFKNLFSDD